MPIPEQQAAIKRMHKLRQAGLSLRAIAAKMQASGAAISHEGGTRARIGGSPRSWIWSRIEPIFS